MHRLAARMIYWSGSCPDQLRVLGIGRLDKRLRQECVWRRRRLPGDFEILAGGVVRDCVRQVGVVERDLLGDEFQNSFGEAQADVGILRFVRAARHTYPMALAPDDAGDLEGLERLEAAQLPVVVAEPDNDFGDPGKERLRPELEEFVPVVSRWLRCAYFSNMFRW